MMDDLSARQMQILQAIILNYLETAEPVGSRTISRRSPLGLSSATIRNEMADLEELGFIIQPHTYPIFKGVSAVCGSSAFVRQNSG